MHILGLETLSLRIDRSSQNAFQVAEYLYRHSLIEKVNYPGLHSSCFNEIAKKQFHLGLCGGLLSFDISSNVSPLLFFNNLKLIKRSSNFNDNKSLVIHPSSTLFCEYSDSHFKNMGINQSTIRLSVGIDDVEDIIEDIELALCAC